MFYEPKKGNHNLPHDPFKGLIAPRPIGWIGSYGEGGIANLAPYSFFNTVSAKPPILCFSSDGYKDSVRNIDATGAFSFNLVSSDLKDDMNKTAAGVEAHVDEFDLAGLEKQPCHLIKASMVAKSPVKMECVHLETKQLENMSGEKINNFLVLGEVIGIHIDDSVIQDGLVKPQLLKPLARMGYMDYVIGDVPFSLKRP